MGQMKGVITFFIITVLCSIVATSAHGTECGCKQKQVIKFYVHDNLLQKEGNTAYIIAGPGGNITHLQQGSLVAINDLITEGPDPHSRKLGNAQECTCSPFPSQSCLTFTSSSHPSSPTSGTDQRLRTKEMTATFSP